jgi:hypothetical protein
VNECSSRGDIDSSSKASKKFKKGYNCECIITLLVKIVYSNKLAEFEKKTSSSSGTFEFDFLKNKCLNDDFLKYRVGDESEFIINLLEKISALDRKCNLIIIKTLETLNFSNNKKSNQDVLPAGGGGGGDGDDGSLSSASNPTITTATTSSDNKLSSKMSPSVVDDDLK